MIQIGCFDIPPNTDSFMCCENCLCFDGDKCEYPRKEDIFIIYNEVV